MRHEDDATPPEPQADAVETKPQEIPTRPEDLVPSRAVQVYPPGGLGAVPQLHAASAANDALRALTGIQALNAQPLQAATDAVRALNLSIPRPMPSAAVDVLRQSLGSTDALRAMGASPAFDELRRALAPSQAVQVTQAIPSPTTSPLAQLLASRAAAPPPISPPLTLPPATPTPRHRLEPMRWRRRLLARATTFAPQLRRRHDGAWDAISHRGPDSVSQAAGSLVELVTGVVRSLAPKDEVVAWVAERGHDWALDPKGNPTLRARVHFILAHAEVPDRSADAYAITLTALMRDLQEVKHGGRDVGMSFVVGALLIFEALLLMSDDAAQNAD